jgi:hypothetical protein
VEEGPNIDDVVSFKILDNLLDEYKGPVSGFEKVLEKKKKLLEMAIRK